MSSLNFTITATQAEFDDFANRLGYQSFTIDELDVPIPNPESRYVFLARVMKERVAQDFYTPFVTAIEQEVDTSREVDKENMREAVRSRVVSNFVA